MIFDVGCSAKLTRCSMISMIFSGMADMCGVMLLMVLVIKSVLFSKSLCPVSDFLVFSLSVYFDRCIGIRTYVL